MDGYQLGDTALNQVRPHRFELGAVREKLTHFHRWIGFRIGSLYDQLSILQCGDRLPLHDTTLFEPFRSVLSDDVLFFRDKLLDGGEESSHRRTPQPGAAERLEQRVPLAVGSPLND